MRGSYVVVAASIRAEILGSVCSLYREGWWVPLLKMVPLL